MHLAGDIGGTKTALALYDGEGQPPLAERTYPSRGHATLEELVAAFLQEQGRPAVAAAAFGVAGAVIGGTVHTTNLPWTVSEADLSAHLHIPRVKILNDLEAAALGMLLLPDDQVAVLNAGQSVAGNVAVIAAGTGLGEAILYWDGKHYQPLASEGGHGDLAPHSDQEIELLRFLRGRFGGHVSKERVLAGPGLHNVYDFLKSSGFAVEGPELAAALAAGDPGAAISAAGLSGQSALAAEALRLFAALYGAEAGNLALTSLAVGGVFVGGGIAPKILPALQSGAFMAAFVDKGRFRERMAQMPVKVALNPKAPLLGAASYARRLQS